MTQTDLFDVTWDDVDVTPCPERPPFTGHPELYADGGLVRANPSRIGGTWAFVRVMGGVHFLHSGHYTPGEHGLTEVTGNFAETLAAILALESMPEGWAGRMHLDSMVAKMRVERCGGLPSVLRDRMRNAVRHLGRFTVHHVKGHASRKALAHGQGPKGQPVSKWNTLCDEACRREARRLQHALDGVVA